MFKFLTGALGGIWLYLAVAVISGGISAYIAENVRWHYDQVAYQALQLKDAAASTASLEAEAAALTANAAQEKVLQVETTQGAVAEAATQSRIVTQVQTITKEVPVYVTAKADTIIIPCIPYGLIRVLDAAALSTADHPVAPSDLALPTGQSDDACSPIKASDLAAAIAGNYGIDGENAEQLNALEAWTNDIIAKVNAEK